MLHTRRVNSGMLSCIRPRRGRGRGRGGSEFLVTQTKDQVCSEALERLEMNVEHTVIGTFQWAKSCSYDVRHDPRLIVTLVYVYPLDNRRS